jgi:hypothetical protein
MYLTCHSTHANRRERETRVIVRIEPLRIARDAIFK